MNTRKIGLNTVQNSARVTRQALPLLAFLIACCLGFKIHAEVPAYVGSSACVDCHVEETEAWTGSHHDLAWTEADDVVLGDFDGAEFSHAGTLTKFDRSDDGLRIRVTEVDGSTTDYDVHSVAGIEPLQQYLIDIGDGRLQSFDVVWDVEQENWYHLYPDQDLAPADGLHWSGPYKSWNARCAECHATGYEKNFDGDEARYSSSQSEIGVGCEACHGPGEVHVAWATTQSIDAARFPGLTDRGFTIGFAEANAEAEIQQCATCHSRREPFEQGNPVPGTDFHDAFRLALLRPGLYHPDGSIQDEVYVYGSFLQSKMYANGVRCSDCHDVHSADLKADGNGICTQCHSPAGNPRFETLTLTDYDTPEHHFHPTGSAGAECKSCHMIERVYMGIDGRRDHSFRVPRPDLTIEIGTPNACNDCHSDETPEWAAAVLVEKFPESVARGPHFGQVLARGRENPVATRSDLVGIARNSELPGIVRATALSVVGPATDPTLAEDLAQLLSDPDPLVRAAAAPIQRGAEMPARVRRLAPLLSDEVKSVRVAAARELLDAPAQQLPNRERQALAAALGEWQEAMLNKLDFPETHLALGGAALVLRNPQAALQAFGEAVDLDPQQAQAWAMLMRINLALGDVEAAREVRNRALAAVPDDPVLKEIAGTVP